MIGGNAAPTSITPDAATVAENAVLGTTAVSGLAAVDPNVGDRAGFYLMNDAGGRFVMIGDKIVVANPTLLDYEAGSSHIIEVKAVDTGGLSRTKSITVTLGNLTGTADNVINGTSGKNELNGTSGADRINGLAGEDRMTGGAGNDILDGGAGKDRMEGGAGNDTYVVDHGGRSDRRGQATRAPTRCVTSLDSFGLGDNFENLVYTGSQAFTGTRQRCRQHHPGRLGRRQAARRARATTPWSAAAATIRWTAATATTPSTAATATTA